MNTLDTIYASALAALPEIGTDGALPADIQVFPPGKKVPFTLQDYPGEHFEMDVDASVAAKACASCSRVRGMLITSGNDETWAEAPSHER